MSKEITISQVSNGFILMFDEEGDFQHKTEVYESFTGVGERLTDFFDYRHSGVIRRDENEEI